MAGGGAPPARWMDEDDEDVGLMMFKGRESTFSKTV